MPEKFKDSKIGKRILKCIPEAAKLIGDILPDKGVLGIAKNLISNSDLTQELKSSLYQDIDRELLKDVQNARNNETTRDISEHSSWLSKNIHEMIALSVVGGWLVTWYFRPQIEYGEITGVVTLILGYLYGRSMPHR